MEIPKFCRLCGGDTGPFSVEGEKVYGGSDNQKFYRCPSCEVAFLFPPISEEDESRFYAQEFEKFMEQRAGSTRDWSGPEAHVATNQDQVGRRMPYIEQYINRPGAQVLELGCSSGFMLLPLRERGFEVIGIEPSGHFTEFVRSKNIPVFKDVKQFREHSGMAGKLDLLVHFFLLEHVSDPRSFLEECLELLGPSGKMFFEVPSRDDPLVSVYDIPAFHDFYWSVAHNWYFNRKSLVFLLDQLQCRYEIIPEQRYDLSNHIWWALHGRPGGMSKFSKFYTPELDLTYKESMRKTGFCDAFFVWIHKDQPSQRGGGAL